MGYLRLANFLTLIAVVLFALAATGKLPMPFMENRYDAFFDPR